MKVAIPTWSGRVSPVLDVATRLLIVEIEGDAEISRHEVAIDETRPLARAEQVAGLGANVLICGAVSGALVAMLVSADVRVIQHRCGAVEDVLWGFVAGRLSDEMFLMPGCCGSHRRLRNRRRGGWRRSSTGGDQTC